MNVVYILFFKDMIKIGKTSNSLQRLDKLKRTYGDFCSNTSYCLICPPHEDVFDIEKTLQKSLKKYKYRSYVVKGKDGYTELFNVDSSVIEDKIVALSHLFDFAIQPLDVVTLECVPFEVKHQIAMLDYQLDYFEERLNMKKIENARLIQQLTELEVKQWKLRKAINSLTTQ